MKLKMMLVAIGVSATALLMANQGEEKETAKTTEEVAQASNENVAKTEAKEQTQTKADCDCTH